MTGVAGSAVVIALAADERSASNSVLLIAAVVAIAVIIVLITALKLHPFIALILGATTLGIIAQFPLLDTVDSFAAGFGTTAASVGILIALGAMIGRLLADSGGADRIVETITSRVGDRGLPWAMALIAAILGLPLFFEVGVVLLIPVVLLVSRRTGQSLMRVGIPALAGLSVMHGLVPPHPGPLAAIATLNVDLGRTLILGIIVAIPTLIICGPLLGSVIAKYVTAEAPAHLIPTRVGGGGDGPAVRDEENVPGNEDARGASTDQKDSAPRRQPKFAAALVAVLLPVVLMLLRAIGEVALDEGNGLRTALTIAGTPTVALLAGLIFAMIALGRGSGMSLQKVNESIGAGLPAIAGILLIVAAGGGFKQTLIDTGVGDVIGELSDGANLSPIVLGWLVAVGIRVGTGSATVATITAAGIVAPLAADLDITQGALLALAIGAGSLFFSHVNDAGFWLVKEYFGLTVGQTLKSWSLMETAISVVGLAFVLLLDLIL